jgi:GTP-binding protein HflX
MWSVGQRSGRHIAAVDTVLQASPSISFHGPVFNKCDQLPAGQAEALCRRYGAIGISALHQETLPALIQQLEERLAALVPVDASSQKSATPTLTLASRP